jgi:hypothetical protein
MVWVLHPDARYSIVLEEVRGAGYCWPTTGPGSAARVITHAEAIPQLVFTDRVPYSTVLHRTFHS